MRHQDGQFYETLSMVFYKSRHLYWEISYQNFASFLSKAQGQ